MELCLVWLSNQKMKKENAPADKEKQMWKVL